MLNNKASNTLQILFKFCRHVSGVYEVVFKVILPLLYVKLLLMFKEATRKKHKNYILQMKVS